MQLVKPQSILFILLILTGFYVILFHFSYRIGSKDVGMLEFQPVALTVAARGALQQAISTANSQHNVSQVDYMKFVYESSWRNDVVGPALQSLLQLKCAKDKTLKIASLGGSASAFTPGHLEQFTKRIQQVAGPCHGHPLKVQTFNPSAGTTGSVWGGLMMKTLIPADTDILLWEMAINDWDPNLSGLNPRDWHMQAFEIYLRRALSVQPNIIVGLLFLWQSLARECWPCPDGRSVFNDVTDIAKRYDVPIFGLDFNLFAQLLRYKTEDLLRDLHHYTKDAGVIAGDALAVHALPLDWPQYSSAKDLKDSVVSVESSTLEKNELLGRIFNIKHPVRSIHWSSPRGFGDINDVVVNASNSEACTVCKKNSERKDIREAVLPPPCSNGGLEFKLTCFSKAQIGYIGLSLRDKHGGLFNGPLHDFGHRINVYSIILGDENAITKVPLKSVSNEDHRHNASLVLQRGFSAPQAWWKLDSINQNSGLGQPKCISGSSVFKICCAGTNIECDESYRIGSAVFV